MALPPGTVRPGRTRKLASLIWVPPSQCHDSHSPPGEIQPVLQGPGQTLSLPCSLLQPSSRSGNDFWPLCSCSTFTTQMHLGHRHCHQTTPLNIPQVQRVKLFAITGCSAENHIHFSTTPDNMIDNQVNSKCKGQS